MEEQPTLHHCPLPGITCLSGLLAEPLMRALPNPIRSNWAMLGKICYLNCLSWSGLFWLTCLGSSYICSSARRFEKWLLSRGCVDRLRTWVAKSRSFAGMAKLVEVCLCTAWDLGTCSSSWNSLKSIGPFRKRKLPNTGCFLSAPISQFHPEPLSVHWPRSFDCPLLKSSCQHFELKCRSPSGAYFVKSARFYNCMDNWKPTMLKEKGVFVVLVITVWRMLTVTLDIRLLFFSCLS